MSARRHGWLSLNRIERRDTLRAVVRRAAADRNLSEREVGASLGYSESRWRRMMTPGELAGPCAADVPLLCEILGGDQLLEEMARARGFRLVSDVVPGAVTETDVLGSAASAIECGARLVTKVTTAIPDGIDQGEARAIQAAIEENRRALARLEALVATRVVEPLRRSPR